MSQRRRRRRIVILLVGLDNAGKTTAAKGLIGEKPDGTVPNVGFSSLTLHHKGYTVIIYDLGGGPQIRDIWTQYFADAHGVIYVVDASDTSRIEESRLVLEEILKHEKLCGKPLLLLANKQDQEGALDEIDVVERLNLEGIVNQQRCPTLVETCSALSVIDSQRKSKLDPGIQNGFRWLLSIILKNFPEVDKRVETDVKTAQMQLEKEKLERKSRLEEQRRKQEETEKTKIIPLRVNSFDDDDDDDSDVIHVKPASHSAGNSSTETKVSHDSGYTPHHNDIDGDNVSAITLISTGSQSQNDVSQIGVLNKDSKTIVNIDGKSFSSPSLKDIVKGNLEYSSKVPAQKKSKFFKISNKTAPAIIDANVSDYSQELFKTSSGDNRPGRLPPINITNRTKLFEASAVKRESSAVKRIQLIKSSSLSLSGGDAEKADVVRSKNSEDAWLRNRNDEVSGILEVFQVKNSSF